MASTLCMYDLRKGDLFSILSHGIDIYFLSCIYMWQISQIQTFLGVVVRPELISTSPAFMRSSASHPDRLPSKTVNRPLLLGSVGVDTTCTAVWQFASSCVDNSPPYCPLLPGRERVRECVRGKGRFYIRGKRRVCVRGKGRVCVRGKWRVCVRGKGECM